MTGLFTHSSTMYPLCPISCDHFNRYLIHGSSCNSSVSLRLQQVLDQDRLRQATAMVMQRHLTLRSRVQVDLTDSQRYFWQEKAETLDAEADLPIEFKTLGCAESDLDDEINALDSQHRNQTIQLEHDYPFRLICIQWQSLTHLQLISSHVAFDGVSIYLFLNDLFQFYLTLMAGEQPIVQPLPYLADWAHLFDISISHRQKLKIQRPLITQYRLQSSGYQEWEALLQKTELSSLTRQDLVSTRTDLLNLLVAFPRIRPIHEIATINPHTAPIATKFFEFTRAQTEGLRRFARRSNSSLHVVLNLAYLQCQLDLAEQQGESVETVFFSYPFNSRLLAHHPILEESIGNFISFQSSKLFLSEPPRDPLALLKKIKFQDPSQAILHHQLRHLLFKSTFLEVVRSEDWVPFLKLFLKQTDSYFQNTTQLATNSSGVMERYIRARDLQIVTCRSIPLTRRYYLNMGMFNQKLSLCAGYIPALLIADQVEEVWARTLHYLMTFIAMS